MPGKQPPHAMRTCLAAVQLAVICEWKLADTADSTLAAAILLYTKPKQWCQQNIFGTQIGGHSWAERTSTHTHTSHLQTAPARNDALTRSRLHAPAEAEAAVHAHLRDARDLGLGQPQPVRRRGEQHRVLAQQRVAEREDVVRLRRAEDGG